MAAVPPRSVERVVVWRQIALGLALFGVYLVVDALPAAGRQVAADRHGRDLYALEQHLNLDIEATLNSWLAPHAVWSTLANYEYAYTYIVSALLLLVWVLLRRPEAFRRTRDSFLLLNLAAFACFAFYPVTPPRLLPDLGFVDTVAHGHTFGSWGSGLVDQANQLAAMPSLHVGWALWVSAVLARLTARRSVQVVSAIHVIVTFLVIVATANHYVLDAVAALVLVSASTRLADAWRDRNRREGLVVPSSDAFFLHVETIAAPQHVGGLVVFESTEGDAPSVARMREVVMVELGRLPRFRQRLAPTSRWSRPRWIGVTTIDWEWHITERHSPAGRAGLRRIVAELAEEPMPRDRPMWRIVLVRDVGPAQSALILLMHHAVADGIGTVIQTLNLMRPRTELPSWQGAVPGRATVAAGTVVGLAQLATDGGPGGRLGAGSRGRGFATAALDLAEVRRVASLHGARITDLVLALVGDAVATTHRELADRVSGRLRVAVPLMVREPEAAAEGNATAAVMVDVPVDGRRFDDLLSAIGQRTARLRTPTRALASRFVMATGLRVLPEPCVTWFARTVYGRRFFHGIVSNMPGPVSRMSMAGVPMAEVYPILPLAPGAPMALGALSWAGILGLGLATDPELLDAGALVARMEFMLGELARVVPAGAIPDEGPRQGGEQART